jgi:hypothetical protein
MALSYGAEIISKGRRFRVIAEGTGVKSAGSVGNFLALLM